MDYQFPQQLFPSFYHCGPPKSDVKHCGGNWGSYGRVKLQGSSGPLYSCTFRSRHQARGETWRHTESIPVPLLSPKKSFLWPLKPPDPLDFVEHMQNFFMDNSQDAFGCMSEILDFKTGPRQKCRKGSVILREVESVLDILKIKPHSKSHSRRLLDRYGALLWDVAPTIPPELLGRLLCEELTEQRDRTLFSEGATGGALAFVPFSENSSDSQRGCLLYPGNQGHDCLNFHRVELQHHRGSSSCVNASSSDLFTFKLNGPIRQISSASLLDDCCVAVRSDRLCGVWRFSETNEPRLLQVVNTKEVATCISVSPHVLGEVLVASESGAVNLWTVGRGMQKVREESDNLCFNAKSPWRWCEFSAHPRVMLYADRTGVDLTDIRVSPVSCQALFRISNTAECHSGERLILSRYLGDVHPFHHLITTQYSAYIMDERFPSMPMLKWDHLMQAPPMFCHTVGGSDPSGTAVGGARTTKVLLGAHSSQEITLLQYSGGRVEACFSQGPPQALLTPRDSLKHLPVQIPHRLDIATKRLSSPAAGLTCIQKRGGTEARGEECICILQLTEAGDIFYQILEPEQPDISGPPAAEDEQSPQPALQEATTSERQTAEQPQPVISDTSSDEDIIEPTQLPAAPRFVAETPEREQPGLNSDSSSEDSMSGWRGRRQNLKRLQLQVIFNDDPELDQVNGLDAGVEDGKVGKGNAESTEEAGSVEETINSFSSSEQQAAVKISDATLVTWKHWLQKLMQKSREKKPRRRRLQHVTYRTESLLPHLDNKARDSTEEERVQSMRRDLRACMSKRSLLVHSTVSASLRAPDVVTLPDVVDTDSWRDEISHRLTLSWQGEEAWRAWWKDQLGLNLEDKAAALRRKRRREKEAKRATGRRLELSGSFTSSISYQSDFDSTGFSSAMSQGGWSDYDDNLSQVEDIVENGTPRAATPSTMNDTLVPTPQSVKYKQSDQQSPSSSRTLTPSQTPKRGSTPANQSRNKHPAKDYLSSLFPPQDEPSQHDSYFLEEGSDVHPPLPPVTSFSSQRSLRMDLSQDTSVLSGFSQSLPSYQSSQGRLGPSQASQPKKKKSRMGF